MLHPASDLRTACGSRGPRLHPHLPAASRGNAVPRPSPVWPGPARATTPVSRGKCSVPRAARLDRTPTAAYGPRGPLRDIRDTGTPGHRDPGTPRHRDIETRDTGTLGHRGPGTLGHRDPGTGPGASVLSFPLGTRLEQGERCLLQHSLRTLTVVTT
ncbi:unnamed protein product [Coccothraustes coccothraustes]